MSDTPQQESGAEQKERIVVNPIHHQAAAAEGNAQGSSADKSTESSAVAGNPNSSGSDISESLKHSSPSSIAQPPVPPQAQTPIGQLVKEVADSVSSAEPSSTEPPVAPVAQGTATGTAVDAKSGLTIPAKHEPGTAPALVSTPEPEVADPMLTSPLHTAELNRTLVNLMKDSSIVAKMQINTLNDYLLTMKPGKIVAREVGCRNQVRFYQALTNIINNLEGKDFQSAMQATLLIFHQHADAALGEKHVFRFVEWVPLSRDHRRGFEKIVTLLKSLADPKSRQQFLKQVNFEPLLKFGLTERGRVKLTAYFGK
ncbi:hypothetical protein [Paraburkholderia sp. BCC1886]|uniref:hypothetical protein n=1 Tax=Paraburkholderia sp. BCC1886 TaxID=2562670 RepID=UPI00118465D6|nr:hypothetical protein [Paraburkholderia sp. BCC1886]